MALKCDACNALPSLLLAPRVCPTHMHGLVGPGGVRWPEWASCGLPEGSLVSALLSPFDGEVGRCWLASMGGGHLGMHREVLASRNYFEFCLQHVQELKDAAEALTGAAGDSKLATAAELIAVVEAMPLGASETFAALERMARMRREVQVASAMKVTPRTLGGVCAQLTEQLAGWRPTPEDVVETAREIVFGGE